MERNEFDTQSSSGTINIDKHEFKNQFHKGISNIEITNKTLISYLKDGELNNNSKNLKSKSEEWFDIPEQEPTEQVMQEFTALRLRNSIGPKSFYKSDDSIKTLPTKFCFGRIVNDNALSTSSTKEMSVYSASKRKAGLSFVHSLLRDANTQKWANKKYIEIQKTKLKGARKWYSRQFLKRKRH